MQPDRPKAPGLRWRNGKPFWRASKRAAAAGYPSKSANLAFLADDSAALEARCRRLHREMLDWLTNPDIRPQKTFRVKRPASWSTVGLIYFAECGGLLKIGFTTDLHGRAMQLQANNLQPVTLLGSMPGTPEIEKFLHWQFRNFHHRGEWFEPDQAAREFIDRHLITGTPREPSVRRRFRRAAHAANRSTEVLINY